MCDAQTVDEDDWEPVDKVFENWVEDSMYMKHNPKHMWYWLSNQTKNEVTVFTLWDSSRAHDKRGKYDFPMTISGFECVEHIDSNTSNRLQPRLLIAAFLCRVIYQRRPPDRALNFACCYGAR